MHLPTKIAATVLLIASVACSHREQETPAHSFRIFDEDGISVAETTGGPKSSEFLFTFELVREIRPPENIEESLLASPANFSRDEMGNYFVVDRIRSDPRIVVFDSTGQFLRTIGSVGDGPGEFRRPVLLNVMDSVLEVFDEGQQRTSYFSDDGNLISIVTLFDRQQRVEALYSSDQGHQIVVQYVIETREEDYWRKRICTIHSPGDEHPIIIETPFVKVQEGTIYAYQDGYPLNVSAAIHFSGEPSIICPNGSGVIISTGEEPVLKWYDLSGVLVREIRLNIPAERVTPEERRGLLKDFRNKDRPRDDARIDWNSLIQFRDPKAFWKSVDIDTEGYIWLEYPIARSDQISASHRLLSPEGEYLGDLRVPHAGGIFRYGEYLVLIRDSETDESIPTVFKLIPNFEGIPYPHGE